MLVRSAHKGSAEKSPLARICSSVIESYPNVVKLVC